MKRDTVNYLVAGSVVLAALLLLFTILYRITGRTGATDDYHVFYQNVGGIKYGTPVYYEGYRIGQVDDVVPDRQGVQTRFRVQLGVDQGWPIPADSVAQVASAGLLSDVFIYIREGESTEALPPGSMIPGEESADLFAALGDLAGEIQALADSELRPLLQLVNERVDSITGDIEQHTPQIVDELQQMMTKLNDSASSVQQLVGEDNRAHVSRTLQNVEQMSATAARLAADLQGSREELDQLLTQVNGIVTDNRPELERIVSGLQLAVENLSLRLDSISFNLDEASRHFNEFTRVIRRNPNRLIYTPDPDDVEGIE